MGLDQFPMFRLATLLARQLSSPIASRIKSYAMTHPVFRRRLIVSTGRAYRAAELRFKMWMLRLGRPPRSPPLSENEATQVGADIIGEMIIFALGAAIVTYEVNRQAYNKELKELDERSQWVAILVGLEDLQREVALQQEDLDRMLSTLREFAPNALPSRSLPKPPPVQPPQAAPPSPDKNPVSPSDSSEPQATPHVSSPVCAPKTPALAPTTPPHDPGSVCPPKEPDATPPVKPHGSRSVCPPKKPIAPPKEKPQHSNTACPAKITESDTQDKPHGSKSVCPTKAPKLAQKSKTSAPNDSSSVSPDSAPQDSKPEVIIAPSKRRHC